MEVQKSNLCEVVKRCRKNIKTRMHKYNKKARCNLPEIHLYCGICDLKTGLYIRSVISVFIYLAVLGMNIVMLYFITNTGRVLSTMKMSDLESYIGVKFTDINLSMERLHKLYILVVIYLILWIIFKVIYIICLFLTIFAIYMKKSKILKIVMLFNIINWIIDILISLFGTVVTQVMPKFLLLVALLFEGYNILAIRSEYKQMRGKSKLLINQINQETDPVNMYPPSPVTFEPDRSIQRDPTNLKHCSTCSCYIETIIPGTLETRETLAPESGSSTNEPLPVIEEKPVNIKDIEIIFNQDLLMPQHSSVLETAHCLNETSVTTDHVQTQTMPKTIDLPSNSEKNFDDIPIIYDENQLNVDGSPVVESRISIR
ncbi:uncharacterized protein [Battus philenor]|uniref:uncharacterized protein n=1 Tax=Battus philenor TaxID=42288 RepID=UPI0035CF8554